MDLSLTDLSFSNFDPDNIQVEETINCVFIVDISPSVRGYVNDLNFAFNDFIESFQKSHIHDRMFVSIIEFNDKVFATSGFQPIIGVPKMSFVPKQGGTALYDAVEVGINNAVKYREDLENNGINVKTLVFVITDGDDNSSEGREKKAAIVKAKLDTIMADERNAFTFTTMMFGVGDSADFTKAKDLMGIQLLATVGQTGADMKKMINMISSSISQSSSGGNPLNVSF